MTKQPEPDATEKAQVILLSGFLGAGKTTLLKQILSWETDLAETVVLVNEFGDVGIDGTLLKDSGSDVVELTSGCICCTLSADLMQSLGKIWTRFNPRRIFIESSGVADPRATANVLEEPELARVMTLAKIIAVLDADFWEAREAFGALFYNQLEMADLILLNKIDLLDDDKAARFLTEIHGTVPDSQIIPTIHCRIDPQAVWEVSKPKPGILKPIQFYQPADGSGARPTGAGQSQAPVDASRYTSFAFESAGIVSEECFYQFLDKLPWEVFRIKGPVKFANRMVLLNFVGGKSEWLPWDGDSKTQLVFIGWSVDPQEILKKASLCVAER